MKIVVNRTFGAFRIPEELLSSLGLDSVWDEIDRYEETLVDWVERHPESELAVVEVPSCATDWEIWEYDGEEHIIACIDGMIRHIYPERRFKLF